MPLKTHYGAEIPSDLKQAFVSRWPSRKARRKLIIYAIKLVLRSPKLAARLKLEE